jgi:uncharacterized SAM-binding protein YcdF (DUF218 family)
MVFFLSKLFWLLVQPLNTILLLVIAGLGLRAAGRARAGLFLLDIGVIYLLLATLIPLGQLLLLPLEQRFEKPARIEEPIDGIIVLGGAVLTNLSASRGEVALGEPGERVTAFLSLARRHPTARLVYSGGNATFPGRPRGTEAGVMQGFLREEGLAGPRLIFEDRSRTTWENAVFSRDIVRPKAHERWLLVTSASHMPRAMGAFRKCGWRVTPYPVDYRTPGFASFTNLNFLERLEELDVALKEWAGLAAYYAMGRSTSLLPGP